MIDGDNLRVREGRNVGFALQVILEQIYPIFPMGEVGLSESGFTGKLGSLTVSSSSAFILSNCLFMV